MISTGIQPPTGNRDPSLAVGSVQVLPELSLQSIEMLEQVATDMEACLPEVMGVTLFGSTARGEARPDSDVDIFLFVQPGENFWMQHDPRVKEKERIFRGDAGSLTGTVSFDSLIGIKYWLYIEKLIKAKGIEKVGPIVVPLDEAIIDQTTEELLQTAQVWDEGDHSIGALVPRNIRALFHVPIHDTKLRPYIVQALTALSHKPSGETAWRMIRHQLIGFERRKTQEDYADVTHRNIPTTLEEACEYYGITNTESDNPLSDFFTNQK